MQALNHWIQAHRNLSIAIAAILVVALLGCRLSGVLPGQGGEATSDDVTRAVEASPKPVELVLSVNVQAEDGKPRIAVETNLPDGLQLTFRVKGDGDTVGRREAAVADGSATVGPFSRDGAPYAPGEYVLHISSPPLSMQPDAVQEQLGENGEGYQGEHITEGRVDFETTFVVPGDQPEGRGDREEHMAFLEDHLAYLDGRLAALLEAAEDETLDWTAWSRAWNDDLEEHEDALREQFGASISEYTGHCQLAFFHVAEAYADIFLLWQRYDGVITDQRDGTELERRTEDVRTLLEDAQAEIAACRES